MVIGDDVLIPVALLVGVMLSMTVRSPSPAGAVALPEHAPPTMAPPTAMPRIVLLHMMFLVLSASEFPVAPGIHWPFTHSVDHTHQQRLIQSDERPSHVVQVPT